MVTYYRWEGKKKSMERKQHYLECIDIKRRILRLFFFFFEFTKASFMAQDVIYPGEGSMCA